MVTPTNQADIQLPVAYPEEGYSEPPENEPNHDTHSTGHAMVSVSTKLSSGHNYGLWALFFLFGIAMLIPWNTWTTAAPFFSERLKGSPFANNFQSWIGLTFMLTNLGSLCALLPFQDRIDPVKRITAGLVLCGIVFFVAVGMLSLTTMNPSTYFICNLILVVLSSIASALVAGMMAFATEFTPLIVTALVSGQGMSGIVPTVVQIVLTVSSSGSSDSPSSGSSHTVAVTKACFFISICISVVSLIGYTILRKSSYAPRRTIRFNIPEHANSSSDGIAEESSSDSLLAGLSPEADRSESFADHWKIWKAVSPSVISMVLNFSVTLALFPTLTSYIQTTQIDATQSSLSTVGDKNQKNLFVLFHFLVFNLSDFVGKCLPMVPGLSRFSQRTLLYASLSRVVFFPLLLLCNITITDQLGNPLPRTFPLVFFDAPYFVILAFLGMSGGWLITLLFVAAPAEVSRSSADNVHPAGLCLASEYMVIALAVGLAIGSAISFVLRWVMFLKVPDSSVETPRHTFSLRPDASTGRQQAGHVGPAECWRERGASQPSTTRLFLLLVPRETCPAMSTIATASKLKRKRSSSSSSSNSSKMLSVVASDGLAHLASLDLPALAASLRAYPVSTLCSTSQAIRRLLLRRYIPDRISKDLAGSSAAGFSHSSSLIQQQPALPIERLCIEGVRASRAAQRLAALPTSSKSIVAIHSSSHRKQLYIDTEIQRTLETVVQIIYHQAVHHSPSFSSSAASYEDLSPDLLELFVSVVQDDYGLLLSSMARKMLITPPSSQEPIVSTKSRILKSIHAPIRNPTSKGASIGMWCHEMLRRESTKDTSIAKRNVIQLLRILTMWVQAKLIDEKTCKGIVSWSMDRFVKYRPPLTDDSLLLTDSILSVVFQIARLDIGCDLAKLAQTCLDLVVLCSVEISSLSSLAAAVFEKALDIYSILAERNRQLRPLVLHQNTVDMVAHLLKLVQLQIEMVSSEQDQVCHATAKGLFDLARVLCQLLILGGSHSKWNSNASFLAVYDEEEEPVHVTDPTNISSFKSILRILTLAGGSPPEVDITSIPKNQLLLCRPSTIQCLTDASQLISSSAIFYLDACKERGIELQLLPKEFSQALVRLILVISQDAYVLQYKHARQQVLCQKLFRLGAHLATCEAFADGFRLIDSVVIRQFICLMGKILEDAIMNSQGQAEVGAVLHMDQQLASAVMKLVARLLERNPSRTILVDAGLLERLICMPYVKIVLSSPTDWQMQIFMGVMSLISRTAHDSNFRFRMKAGVVGIDSRDGSFGTSLATSLSVLAPPSPNGVVSFMVSLVIGSIYLLCTHRPSLLGHTYRVNLEHAATHAIDFLNENFGRDKSVVTVLCRPNLSEWMSEDILFVNGLSELCTGVDISMINSLLDLLGYIPENSTFDLLNLDIGETVPLKDKEDSKPIEAKTLHSAAYFLDAMLRFSATLGEMLKQKQTVRRLVQTALDAQDLKVQNVVQRITRRLFLGPILVQDMVLSSGYSTIMETLMDGLNDAHRTIHAERLLDGMLGSFSSDIILMDGSPSDQIKHPIQKQHHTCLVQTQTQTALDEALGLAMRIWRYGEQASTTNSSSKLFRDRARTAVCYLGADRLLRLHRSPLLSSEDDYFSENEATTFLWDVFSTVFSDPLSEETGTNIAIDLSKSYRGREASCEIEPENVAVDTSDDEVLLSWVHQRLRKALDFLGWRHLRHAERISDSKMGLPRPHLLIEVLSDEHIWTYKGTADTERPVTIVFADERDSLIRFDGDILENVSPAFSVMMNGPFSEHVSRCVKIQDASREVWVHILEFLLLDVTTSSDVDTVKTENILVKEETRPNPSCMWVSGAATGDMLRKFILVSKMYECASRYMMTRLQHECTAWMSVACLYAARSHNWELAIQLHWWIARHPDMHLYEGSAANTAVILRACNVRALLWSIKNAPQEKPITSI